MAVTKEQIKLWEKTYGSVKVITLDREVETIEDVKTGKRKEVVVNKGVRGYFRRPDRATVRYAMSKASMISKNPDMISAGEVILKKCFLGGDEGVNVDDKYYFRMCISCYSWLNEIAGLF